jgi:hypothetical protein
MDPNIELQDRFLERFFTGPLASNFYLTSGTALARFISTIGKVLTWIYSPMTRRKTSRR